jgi:hypothetical protein
MPVVNCRNSADDAGSVIENRLDHMRLNAKPGHAGCGRAAQIVQRPGRDPEGARRIQNDR